MKMEKLLKEWNAFLNKEVKKHNRIVLNEMAQLTEEEIKSFPLSAEELDILREWGNLQGEPLYLGTGTMGSAYQFGDKVLKITSDDAETVAAAKIAGLSHPHVYKIDKVGVRRKQFAEMPHQRFAIVYELVGDPDASVSYPSKEAQEVIKSIHNSQESIKFNWPDNFKECLDKFRTAIQENPSVLDMQVKGGNNLPKLEELTKLANLNEKEKQAVIMSWTHIVGLYGKDLSSVERALEVLDNKSFDYYDQICSGLTFLNKHDIKFTDLKTTNVLREDDDNLIIIDIGKSHVRNASLIPNI